MTQPQREDVRDRGVTLAIDAAGGVGPLARKLGISQPSVSGWTRVPAERVAAVEAATGVSRALLRPDLFATGTSATAPSSATARKPCGDDLAMARAREYLLLAALLTRPPSQALLDELSQVTGDATALGLAHIGLAEAAAATTDGAAGREYFNLFIGVGRGELLPYASYYLTGFLNERPLARVREDMQRLGVVRRAGVYEPEDHIGSLFEVMAGLVTGEFGRGSIDPGDFLRRHVVPWGERLFADLAVAENAKFYKAVAEVGRVWLEIETEALSFRS